MTKEEIDGFRVGYSECRGAVIFRLRKLLEEHPDSISIPQLFLEQLQQEQADDLWRSVQEEFPGITREEYNAGLEETYKAITERYYHKNGSLKPRPLPTKRSTGPGE